MDDHSARPPLGSQVPKRGSATIRDARMGLAARSSSLVKRFARRILGTPNGAEEEGERAAGWYDRLYTESDEYHLHYSDTCDYFVFAILADRIRRAGLKRVLEIGCGSGQLAQLLFDQGIQEYTGVDFSAVSIDLARKTVPAGRFVVDDARTSQIYSECSNYDVVVCTEVLEHVVEDLAIVSRFPPRIRCICCVPDFPYESHVRHFKDAAEVEKRYGRYFEDFDVMVLKRTRGGGTYFLFDGHRSESE